LAKGRFIEHKTRKNFLLESISAQPRTEIVVKKYVANFLTPICSALIYLLHNRNTFPFSRLELQAVQFSFSQFGEDLAVGLDFARCRPYIITVEALNSADRDATLEFLSVCGYRLEVFLPPTCVLVQKDP
jgi:hypothetical protein